jgi:membrane fusion protein, heavy metal efflux system
MSRLSFVFVFTLSFLPPLASAADNSRRDSTVILDETGVQNLRIQTAVVEPTTFEETVFALGRIEVFPGNRAVVSSRIAGRATEVLALHDHPIKKGERAVVVESRQIGNPTVSVDLLAPLSGLVSAVNVVNGEPVDPDKSLIEIIDLTTVYALARVPEHVAGKLRSGQPARIRVAAVSGEIFSATLEHLGAEAEAASGTVEAAFHVANPTLALRPGMRAEFTIVTAQRANITSVPRAALQGSPSHRFVYVKDFDLPFAFVKTPVVIGESNGDAVEIMSGLLPADEVVTQGAYSLAFSGTGSVSLKEALDAAHGHEHNADGSEISAKKSAASAHDHAHDDHDAGSGLLLWKILTGVFFVAFIAALFLRKPGVSTKN